MKPEKYVFVFAELFKIIGFFLLFLLFFSSLFYSSTYNRDIATLLVIILTLFLVWVILGTSFMIAPVISEKILKSRNLKYSISQQTDISNKSKPKGVKISQIQILVLLIVIILRFDFIVYFSPSDIYLSVLRLFSFILILLGLYILLPISIKTRLFHRHESSKS